ncbi:hypothetical protein ACFYXH_15190 [Streptomyces sp. NPDC002730]
MESHSFRARAPPVIGRFAEAAGFADATASSARRAHQLGTRHAPSPAAVS